MSMTPLDNLMETLVVVKNQLYLAQRGHVFNDQIINTVSEAQGQVIALQAQHRLLVQENDTLKANLLDMARKLVEAHTQVVLYQTDDITTSNRHKCAKCGMMCQCITKPCSNCRECHLREMRALYNNPDDMDGGFRSGEW